MLESREGRWDYLIKPYKVLFEQSDAQFKGTIVVEPLERGFGLTLGNALRRVLLSSIKGGAVTAVRFSGALLEFSNINGVREDVTDIILNLKSLSLKVLEGGPHTVSVFAKGPCVVTAAMIDSLHVQPVIPSQEICTVGEGGVLEMTLKISTGKGYVPARLSESYEMREIGEIALDAQFSPIRRVSYRVENARVGQSTDFDRLILDVETDGSILPEEAVSAAAGILRDQLGHFVAFQSSEEKTTSSIERLGKKNMPFPKIFFKHVKDLELSVRCLNCLQSEGIVYVGDLVKRTEASLMKTANFGRKSLNDIQAVLERLGLSLGMECDFPPKDMDKYLKENHLDERSA